jgi:tetratricopeptide (TPR) repeat protein
VARVLALKLNDDEQRRLTRHHPANTEAYQLYLQGRYYDAKFTYRSFVKAIEGFNQAIALAPRFALAYVGLAEVYFHGATLYFPPNEALPRLQEAAALAMCYTGAGKKRKAEQLLAELQQPGTQHFVAPSYLALTCTARGEADQSFAWLDQAVAAQDESVPLLKIDPRVDGLRADPRFVGLLRRVGLTQ